MRNLWNKEPWDHGIMEPWDHGIMGSWSHRTIELGRLGTVQWFHFVMKKAKHCFAFLVGFELLLLSELIL